MENENENNNENVGIDSNTSDNVNTVDNDSALSPLNFALSGLVSNVFLVVFSFYCYIFFLLTRKCELCLNNLE